MPHDRCRHLGPGVLDRVQFECTIGANFADDIAIEDVCFFDF